MHKIFLNFISCIINLLNWKKICDCYKIYFLVLKFVISIDLTEILIKILSYKVFA